MEWTSQTTNKDEHIKNERFAEQNSQIGRCETNYNKQSIIWIKKRFWRITTHRMVLLILLNPSPQLSAMQISHFIRWSCVTWCAYNFTSQSILLICVEINVEGQHLLAKLTHWYWISVRPGKSLQTLRLLQHLRRHTTEEVEGQAFLSCESFLVISVKGEHSLHI